MLLTMLCIAPNVPLIFSPSAIQTHAAQAEHSKGEPVFVRSTHITFCSIQRGTRQKYTTAPFRNAGISEQLNECLDG